MLSREGIEALLEVRKQILDDPNSFNMNSWGEHCGTPCCIAGHVVANAKGVGYLRDSNSLEIDDTACKILGIEEGGAKSLFMVNSWPNGLKNLWLHAEDECVNPNPLRAEIAARRIDQFIEEHSC